MFNNRCIALKSKSAIGPFQTYALRRLKIRSAREKSLNLRRLQNSRVYPDMIHSYPAIMWRVFDARRRPPENSNLWETFCNSPDNTVHVTRVMCNVSVWRGVRATWVQNAFFITSHIAKDTSPLMSRVKSICVTSRPPPRRKYFYYNISHKCFFFLTSRLHIRILYALVSPAPSRMFCPITSYRNA